MGTRGWGSDDGASWVPDECCLSGGLRQQSWPSRSMVGVRHGAQGSRNLPESKAAQALLPPGTENVASVLQKPIWKKKILGTSKNSQE